MERLKESLGVAEWVWSAQVRGFRRLQAFMCIPSELVPRCSENGEPMTMNLRCDDRFVEDCGWWEVNARYADFVRQHSICLSSDIGNVISLLLQPN